jgi:chemotaxis protein MotA
VIGIVALCLSVILEGGDLTKFTSPSAALIVFGGTLGAAMTSAPISRIRKLPSLIVQALTRGPGAKSPQEIVGLFVTLAEKARREGLLSLEEEVNKIEDPFIRKGTLLVVDGIDPDLVQSILDIDIAAMAERHQQGYGLFESMGGYAPTMGIIGTVMGLVHVVLSSLSNPADLGPAIAVAFIATFYGVSSANLIWLPIGLKLKAQSQEEITLHELAREGILAVQAGDNPRIVHEKLQAFLASGERDGKAKKPDIAAAGAGAAQEAAVAAGVSK